MKSQRNLFNRIDKSIFLLLAIILLSAFAKQQSDKQSKQMKYTYEVLPCDQEITIDANWDKPIWTATKTIVLENFMGEKPVHFPKTEMKMRYDKNYVYVIFRVHDQFVRAIAKETNGKVWEDSCVEFFFTPVSDTDAGYFNLETNCIGTFLMQYHNLIANDDGFVRKEDFQQIQIKSSLKQNVDTEVTDPLVWHIEYKLPVSILSNYLPFEQPGPGVKWRANFYKCADESSHPHWLTWAPVNFPKPKFHLPEFFGWLEFK